MNAHSQRNALSQPGLGGPGRIRPAEHLLRAAFAAVIHDSAPGKSFSSAANAAIDMYPGDPIAPRLVSRGVSLPASMAVPTWAGAVSISVVGDFVSSLAPQSAAARLIDAGMKLSLDGVYAINLPRRVGVPAGDDVWIAEGQPIPVRRFDLTTNTLGPVRKFGSIVTMTREVVDHTTGETVMRTLLQEDAAASLDASMFSTAAATSARPAGLLNGVTPLTAATGGSDAMLEDLERLAGAISDAGGGEPVYIANPRQATSADLRIYSSDPVVVWPCRALAAGTVIAIDPLAFASAFGPIPNISASSEVIVQMEDTNPTEISTPGSPATVSAPVRSAWQTDCVVLRMILDAAWTMRAPGCVQYITGSTWGMQ